MLGRLPPMDHRLRQRRAHAFRPGRLGRFHRDGGLNNAIPFSLITWGQTAIESGLTSILNGATAFFGIIVAAAFLADERLTPARVLGVMIGMAASGIGMFVLSGAGDILFGGAPGPLPDFDNFAPRVPHGIGAKLIIALLALHIGAALYHHFLRRDQTLRRIWFAALK